MATRGILPLRRNVVILDPKGGDKTLTSAGYKRRTSFPTALELATAEHRRYRINPAYGASASRVFHDVFAQTWKGFPKAETRLRELMGWDTSANEDGWTIYFDEARILSEKLRLRQQIETVMVAGRSKRVTAVASFQAARYVPSELYDQPTYFAIGNVRDKRTLRRLSEIGGDSDMLTEVLPTLAKRSNGPSEFLFLGPDWAAISTYRDGTRRTR